MYKYGPFARQKICNVRCRYEDASFKNGRSGNKRISREQASAVAISLADIWA